MALVKVQRISDGKVVWIQSDKVNPEQHKAVTDTKKARKPRGKKNADSE